MRKALAHIFLLGLLLQTGLAHAIVLPHAAIAETAVQSEGLGSRYGGAGDEKNSHISKDFVINDWEDFDECDFDDNTTSFNGKGYFAALSAKENLLAVSNIHQLFNGKVYTDFNFSRLPRYNYISLRVLRI